MPEHKYIFQAGYLTPSGSRENSMIAGNLPLNSGERLQVPLARCCSEALSEHGEASVIYDVTKSWEVRKEEKAYFRFHTVARDESKYAVVQASDWN